jgi:hypothetical protein
MRGIDKATSMEALARVKVNFLHFSVKLFHTRNTSISVHKKMPPHPETCSNKRCPNKGRTLSLDYFRQGDAPPDCYVYHRRCCDCRKTRPIPLPSHLPSPSPARAPRRHCTRCHRRWSMYRFPDQSRNNQYCIYCRK